MTQRRNFLKLIGGGTIVAAGAAAGFMYASAPSSSAREPWRLAGRYDDVRRNCLSYALLAPNPHNRQPWLVALDGEDGITLFCDLDRRLPATDPFDRQITIGCGAFLELLAMSAAQQGYRAEITPFPEGEDFQTLDNRPIAYVRLVPDASVSPDPLFEHVLERRSNKEVYEPTDVPVEALIALQEAGRSFGVDALTIGNTELAAQLRDLTWQGHYVESTTSATMQESVDLMRIGRRQVSANPDGIELEGAIFTLGQWLGFITPEALGDPTSSAFQQGLELYRTMANSARAFGWLTTPDGERVHQLNAGRSYVRLNLRATQLGLGIHPWSQPLQEYAEMSELYHQVHGLIGQDQRIQMLFRIGYAKPVIPTPRRGLDAHIV